VLVVGREKLSTPRKGAAGDAVNQAHDAGPVKPDAACVICLSGHGNEALGLKLAMSPRPAPQILVERIQDDSIGRTALRQNGGQE